MKYMYDDDDDDNDGADDDVSGRLPHGSPVPGSGQPRPAAAARPHVLPRNLPPLPGIRCSYLFEINKYLQIRLQIYNIYHKVISIIKISELSSSEKIFDANLSNYFQGDIMQCGLGKPFNIPSSKLGERCY